MSGNSWNGPGWWCGDLRPSEAREVKASITTSGRRRVVMYITAAVLLRGNHASSREWSAAADRQSTPARVLRRRLPGRLVGTRGVGPGYERCP